MNRKMILYVIGQILLIEAACLMLPFATALIYSESVWWVYLAVSLCAAFLGAGLMLTCKVRNSVIFAKEGFVITALSWIILSLVGALPFCIAGEIPSYVDAIFETVSGFTTTGASILSAPQNLTRAAMMWRSFTHWLGGMGVIVLVMALMPSVTGRSMHILRAEVPGPSVDKLVPKVRDSSKILYLIYITLTLSEIIVLWACGMPLFESIVHSFGTAGTGGFGVKPNSIGGYAPVLQWVITIYMLMFGVNFNVYYLILRRRLGSVVKSIELWTYVGFVALAVAVISFNIYPMYSGVSETVRVSAFQVSSIITTTGFSTVDFNLWPTLSKSILFMLMFMGGCAGSTAGGLKVSRVVLLFKIIRREVQRILHPRSVNTVQMDGKPVNDDTLQGVGSYFIVYMVIFAVVFLLICFEPFGLETNISAVNACFNNVGPGFAAVGPAANFAAYTNFSKIVLSFAMLLGRLEIYPILFMLIPSTWTKK